MCTDPVPFTLEVTQRTLKNRHSPDKGAVGVNTRLLAVLTKGKCNYRKAQPAGEPEDECLRAGEGSRRSVGLLAFIKNNSDAYYFVSV